MRIVKRCLTVLATLLLVAAGAAMPFAASYMQDARQAGSEVWSFDPFRLTLKQEEDVSRVLEMITGMDYYIAETQHLTDARLSEGEALSAAEEILTVLIKQRLLEDPKTWTDFPGPGVWPQTMMAWDNSIAVPTWVVSWQSDTQYIHIWLDDVSGKAFMISVPSPPKPNPLPKSAVENVYIEMEAWRVFLENHYGVEVQVSYEEWYDTAVKFNFSFLLGGEQTDLERRFYSLDLYMYFDAGFTTLSPYVSTVNGASVS